MLELILSRYLKIKFRGVRDFYANYFCLNITSTGFFDTMESLKMRTNCGHTEQKKTLNHC